MRSRWGLSKAVLSLCAARIHQLVLAQHVIMEVEGALLEVLADEPVEEANDLLSDYFTFIDKARPVIAPLAATQEITAASRIIHHLNDGLFWPLLLTPARTGCCQITQNISLRPWRSAPDCESLRLMSSSVEFIPDRSRSAAQPLRPRRPCGFLGPSRSTAEGAENAEETFKTHSADKPG
jgi:hypothetical protein